MRFLTPRGHVAYGVVWTLGMLIMILAFSGAGSLRYAPWLLLLLPFAGVRIVIARGHGDREAIYLKPFVLALNALVELTMAGIFFYLYSLAIRASW